MTRYQIENGKGKILAEATNKRGAIRTARDIAKKLETGVISVQMIEAEEPSFHQDSGAPKVTLLYQCERSADGKRVLTREL